MEIEVLEKAGNQLRFALKDSYPAFANALRRIMVSEIPCMAVEDVFIYESSSSMSDEMIAHRLALVPIKTDLDSYVLPEECTCKSEMGCNKCRAIVSLEAEAHDAVETVYSGVLKFEDKQLGPVTDNIILLKLAPGQRIRLEAHAKLGRGKQHAKWQPVTACAYKITDRDSASFEFFVETTGCLPPERVITEAVDVLVGKVDELTAEVKKLKG
ncbi:MAG: DNA-directed RNA polymerase subunit D [Candidatus Bathyarchaeia archaeon]